MRLLNKSHSYLRKIMTFIYKIMKDSWFLERNNSQTDKQNFCLNKISVRTEYLFEQTGVISDCYIYVLLVPHPNFCTFRRSCSILRNQILYYIASFFFVSHCTKKSSLACCTMTNFVFAQKMIGKIFLVASLLQYLSIF